MSSQYSSQQPENTYQHDSRKWITLYHHSIDQNDQIAVENFDVFVCGPPTPSSPSAHAFSSAALRGQSPPPASSVYSGDTFRAAAYQAPAPGVVVGPEPRRPIVVTTGLAGPRSGDGVLSELQRLHLQSWLNDCRQCSANGVHRAAFPPESHGFPSRVRKRSFEAAQFGRPEGKSGLRRRDAEQEWQTVYLSTPPLTPSPPGNIPSQEEQGGPSYAGHTSKETPSLATLISTSLRSPVSSSRYGSDPVKTSSEPLTAHLRREYAQESPIDSTKDDHRSNSSTGSRR